MFVWLDVADREGDDRRRLRIVVYSLHEKRVVDEVCLDEYFVVWVEWRRR